ncbi:MAG: cation-translocating P-type ATPase [Saprospiraceae bacterium]|nr:cation-translocating P-type ATPase [Saprospiraceae bacterium]
MSIDNFGMSGLSSEQVLESRQKFGDNQIYYKKHSGFLDGLKSLAKEPMILLLLVAATIYFVSGNQSEGIFMVLAIILVASISLFQDSRSRNALEKLKAYSQPNCKVIRNGEIVEIKVRDLVVGDKLVVEEGITIPADGTIIHSNDFSANESVLTGESLSVYKDAESVDNAIFRGTTVSTGLAVATVTKIGNATKIGQVGESLDRITEEKTPLEIQISDFVKKMVIAGAGIFLIVWAINYYRSLDLLASLINALTLAMSILPEEIPVAFTTFMALGAWRLMKMGVVVKQMKTVETLGSATVICTDKTGTITENKMELAKLYVHKTQALSSLEGVLKPEENELIRMAMWASEPIPFDPMELALHRAYEAGTSDDERAYYHMVHEYPLGGKPPMMTHVFENATGNRIVAAKGAPEAIINISGLTEGEKTQIQEAIKTLASQGYRVLGVAEASFTGNNFPAQQQDFQFSFKGIVAFYDPPKKNIRAVFDAFHAAGIAVKIITGDNAETTTAIAKQIGFNGYEKSLTGDVLMALSEEELKEKVAATNIFTRMFPEAKLKIINALKAGNEIVAMTGDGVNDGPALKAAHIGIAMGKKGTEVAKEAASLVLLEDDLSKMVDAIAMGRRIYTNLKKAIQYIISIHIPIILIVFIPLALGWIFPNIFSPSHVILLELIMGPTCSIIYENEPMENGIMSQKPRPFKETFFNRDELITSIIQGLVITIGTLFIYQYAVGAGYNETTTRTMVFSTLIAANIFLTLGNRSFISSVFTTLKYKNNLVLLIIGLTIVITGLLLFVRPLTTFFEFEPLTAVQILICAGTGCLSVIWYELVKWRKRKNIE